MSFPCPLVQCKHHKENPFSMEALLKNHVDSAEHVFIEVWDKGPAAPQIDDFGTDAVTIFWSPVPGATHYELQIKQLNVSATKSTGETKTTHNNNTTFSDANDDSWTLVAPSWTTVSTKLTSTIVKKKGLIPNTTYLVRYRAADNISGCLSPFSLPSNSFKTLNGTINRLHPPILYKNGITSNSLTVTWDTIENGNNIKYDVQIRQVTFPPNSWDHVATISSNAIKKNGLKSNTKYEFRVGYSMDNTGMIYSSPSEVLKTSQPYNPFKQLLGATLINRSSTSSIENILTNKKLVFLYFSASWCPPCKQFTPILSQFYNESIQLERSLEIVFVSADRDVTSFQEYFMNEHPWHAIPYHSANRTQTSAYFKVNGIPKLIVFNGTNGTIVCDNAVQQIMTLMQNSNKAEMNAVLNRWEKV